MPFQMQGDLICLYCNIHEQPPPQPPKTTQPQPRSKEPLALRVPGLIRPKSGACIDRNPNRLQSQVLTGQRKWVD